MPLHAQLGPPSTGGLVALEHELGMLGHNQRVLMIGAHPDDEDTELLTMLGRGMGVEAAYLSLNRGEGGQNLIGPELGEALGILRTEELLAARQLDGARQFFTRAYDFGFSKTLDDTWAHWPRDSVLKDVVRIVRRFRPQIIVSIFSGTPRDGHGQHQAAGWAAREAFRIAGDPTRFPELESEEGFAVWQPLKLYRSTRFDSGATTLVLDGGSLDRAVGKSYHQIAMAGRSLHRSQDMGQLQRIGPSFVRLALIEDRTGSGGEPLFAGIDTTLPASGAQSIERADQRRHQARVDAIRAGFLIDALAEDDRVVAGETISVTTLVANGGRAPVEAARSRLSVPDDWSVEPGKSVSCAPARCAIAPGRVDTSVATVAIEPDASLTTPYYLALRRAGDLYVWPAWARSQWGAPFEAPPARLELEFGADSATISREVSFRFNDQARGEVRRPLTVVPRVDVRLDRDTLLVADDGPLEHTFSVTLGHGARDTTRGSISLEVPPGWPEPAPQEFALTREDQRETFRFSLSTPRGLTSGSYEVRAVATDHRGRRHDAGLVVVDYPHIRPRAYLRPAAATVVAAPLVLPRLTRVGYVRGAADRVPEALLAVGVPIELLDAAKLEHGDLSAYDAIIVGPRAYETDPALVEQNGRLLDYTRAGGLLIVQYQQYQFLRGGFAPLPLTIAAPHDRVADERAPVRILEPSHPAVTSPNRLGPDDWKGWVQERGLYFARTWDPAYRAVLELHDPGTPPLEGGLLIAPLGHGTYVYTGIAFFRALPAGVPGAFRLFANLLALPHGAVP